MESVSRVGVTRAAPNNRLQPTPYSLCYVAASGRG